MNKTRTKKPVMVMLLMALLFELASVPKVNAMSGEEVNRNIVKAINTHIVRAELAISGKNANCNVYVRAKTANSKISGTMKLKKISGKSVKTVKTWNLSSDHMYLSDRKNCEVTKGEYKLVVSVTITSGKTSETITRTDTAVCS